jgi:hypothetical protein
MQFALNFAISLSPEQISKSARFQVQLAENVCSVTSNSNPANNWRTGRVKALVQSINQDHYIEG